MGRKGENSKCDGEKYIATVVIKVYAYSYSSIGALMRKCALRKLKPSHKKKRRVRRVVSRPYRVDDRVHFDRKIRGKHGCRRCLALYRGHPGNRV